LSKFEPNTVGFDPDGGRLGWGITEIAVIRTFLNYLLGDIEKFAEPKYTAPAAKVEGWR